jgi:hypothetical protein
LKAVYLGTKGTWREVADAANTTIHKEAGTQEPSAQWKRRMLLCEHSPIRQIMIKCKWYELKYWVSVHFVRHKVGIEHWVRTQRGDRTGIDRNELPQSNDVEHEFIASAQAIINISRKRLCSKAAIETREAWLAVLESIKEGQPELYDVCVPDCIYRGWCYEYKSCGYFTTPEFHKRLEEYRNGINNVYK